jgi:DNA-binding NtrC family response regulator
VPVDLRARPNLHRASATASDANSTRAQRRSRTGKTITDVMQALVDYDWPGNVRELENAIERAMIASPHHVLQLAKSLASPLQAKPDAGETLEAIEREHIHNVLEACHGTIKGKGQAAERLGLPPSTLRSRMKKLGISRKGRTESS